METIEHTDTRSALQPHGSTTLGIDLLQPRESEPVEADVITFTWRSKVRRASFRLQIAQDAAFQQLCCDVPVGDANSLVLHAAFVEIGKTYYWRVGAEDEVKQPAWSPAAQFKAASEAEVQTYQSFTKAVISTAAPVARRQDGRPRVVDAEPIAPHRTGTTSPREAAVFFSIMVFSFTLTLAILMYLGASMPG